MEIKLVKDILQAKDKWLRRFEERSGTERS
jgi:hypothetical protein